MGGRRKGRRIKAEELKLWRAVARSISPLKSPGAGMTEAAQGPTRPIRRVCAARERPSRGREASARAAGPKAQD